MISGNTHQHNGARGQHASREEVRDLTKTSHNVPNKTSASQSGLPVNIRKSENAYVVEIAAPGLERENFTITLEKGVLTVTAKPREESGVRYHRKEFGSTGYTRTFSVSSNIDTAAISAEYKNGVLYVLLPLKNDNGNKQIRVQ